MPENCSKKPVFKVKIAYLWVEFSPRRRQVGQNLMRRIGKEIFRTFRISNQIFHSIYGSRDIERSLDTTLAVFSKNLNFVDEYLENGSFFKCAVFCKCFVLIPSTILELFIEIVRAISEKISKNRSKMHVFVIFGWTRIFFKNRASSLFYPYEPLTSCKKSEKSLEPFRR